MMVMDDYIPITLDEKIASKAKEYGLKNPILRTYAEGETDYDYMESALIFQEAAQWLKEEILTKACKWLKENTFKSDWPSAKVFVEYFKRAMELADD